MLVVSNISESFTITAMAEMTTGNAAAVAAGGGIAGGVAGGAAGGAVAGGVNYAGNSFAGNGGFTWEGFGDALWKGAATGAVGGGVGAAIGSGLIGAAGGGFAGGATGSVLNGGDGWDILEGGVIGAGVGAGVYLGTTAALAAKEYFSYRSQEKTHGFSREGLNDLYQKQNAVDESYGFNYDKIEYGLVDNEAHATRLQLRLTRKIDPNTGKETLVYRNRIAGPINEKNIHAHGRYQSLRMPSEIDYKSAIKVVEAGQRMFVMDTPTKIIYEINGNGIIRTYDYHPNPTYSSYFKARFSW